MNFNRRFFSQCLASLALVLSGAAAHAALISADLFHTVISTQSNPGSVDAPSAAFWTARGYVNNAGDFDSGTLTFPGPASPAPLTLESPGLDPYWIHGSPGFATQAEMSADSPFGLYTITLNNSVTANSESATFNYSQDHFPGAAPQVTASTYNGLQGMDSTQAFNVAFNPFIVGAGVDDSFIFMPIYDALTGDVVADSSFVDPSQTSLQIGANTLLAGHQYVLELVFSNRIGSMDGNVFTSQGFDWRTDVFFTTAEEPVVPEPATLGMISLGIAGAGWMRRRRKAA